MAKRRRKNEEEEEFKLPEFNEEEFLRKELIGTKVMILTVLLAIAGAIIAYLFTLADVVVVAFFAGFSLLFLLKYVTKFFGVDSSKFERKDWFGHWITYIFAWLAIWILLLNVPFSDVTQPSMTVFVNGNELGGSLPYQVQINGTQANITVKATDNAGIKGVYIKVGSNNQIDMTRQDNSNIWLHTINVTNSSVSVIVTTEDVSGNPPVSISFIIYK